MTDLEQKLDSQIQVTLLHHTPLEIAIGAIRQCYDSGDKSDSGVFQTTTPYFSDWQLGPKDKALLTTIVKSGHGSTLEHISYNFKIDGISRLNLQELARHRMASLSVKSTRYTLKELKTEPDLITPNEETGVTIDWIRAGRYINTIGNELIDHASLQALDNLRRLVQRGLTNDETKYALPECYRLSLYWTINARSLMNFLHLRDSDRAHPEIRVLARQIRNLIPSDHKFLYEILT